MKNMLAIHRGKQTELIKEVRDMKYKKSDDNRYRVRFTRATEELMDALTVKEFIFYLEENEELEDDVDYEYIDGKVVKCKAYELKEADSNLHKEFLVTEDGRLFYWLSLISKIELVDRDETTEESNTDDFVVARNEHDEYMYGVILGECNVSEGMVI